MTAILSLALVASGVLLLRPTDPATASQQDAASAPASDLASAPATDLCATHGAPVDLCYLCDPSLREEGRLWCRGHDRYEDRCWSCHPELRDPERAYCETHGLYEDECFFCDPGRAATATGGTTARSGDEDGSATDGHGHADAASDGDGAHGLHCREHDLAESECGICHPELAAGLAPGQGIKVRLPSPRSAELAGVRVASPQRMSTAGGVRGYAEVDYDRNRLAQITPLVDGVVQRVRVDLGDSVIAGQPLVDIASTQVAEAKQAFLTARQELRLRRQELERERRLHEQEIAAEREVQEAETAFARAQTAAAAAEQNLRNLGLDDEDVARIAETGDTTTRLTIRAPFEGVVIERAAVMGEAVEHWAPLLEVADLSHMWLELSLPESALPSLRTGLPVTAGFSALPGREVAGELVWIAAGLDERTRMLRARAEVPNPDGLLKAGLYGEAEVGLAGDGTALAVPVNAVRSLEQRPYVFVREGDDLFVLRRVEVGGRQGEHVAVLAGLAGDEPVVVDGGYALFTELLKSRLGAGCAGD